MYKSNKLALLDKSKPFSQGQFMVFAYAPQKAY